MLLLKNNETNFIVTNSQKNTIIYDSLIDYLQYNVTIENEVTFKQLFDIILKHHDEYSKFFKSYLNGIELKEFISEWNSDDHIYNLTETDILDIKWTDEYISSKNKVSDFSGMPYISMNLSEKNLDSDISYLGIEYVPLNELKKCRVNLHNEFQIFNSDYTTPIVKLQKTFTMFDILVAIFMEITYVGNPQSRNDEKIQIIKRRPVRNVDVNAELNNILRKYKIDVLKK